MDDGIGSNVVITEINVNERSPEFASEIVGNNVFLRLTTSSRAIDAGDNTYLPAGITEDLVGNDRIQNTTVDLGAYEGAFLRPNYILATTSPSIDENTTSVDLSELNTTDVEGIASFDVNEGSGPSNHFGVTITPTDTTLVVLAGATLDAETATSHDITIQGKAASGNEVGNALSATITINDVNDEAPTTPTLSLPTSDAVATYGETRQRLPQQRKQMTYY